MQYSTQVSITSIQQPTYYYPHILQLLPTFVEVRSQVVGEFPVSELLTKVVDYCLICPFNKSFDFFV